MCVWIAARSRYGCSALGMDCLASFFIGGGDGDAGVRVISSARYFVAGGGGGLSPLTVYTMAFFAFWAIFSVAGYVTVLLSMSAADVNQRSTAP